MCVPPEAILMAIQIGGKYAAYQDKKTKYRTDVAANAVAAKNASRSLHQDYGQIDYQKSEAVSEKVRETVRTKIEKINAMATQLNLNVGNASSIMKDVGTEYETDYIDVGVAYDRDIIDLNRKELEAFGAYERTINDLPVPYKPSRLGLAIGVAESGLQYQINTKN